MHELHLLIVCRSQESKPLAAPPLPEGRQLPQGSPPSLLRRKRRLSARNILKHMHFNALFSRRDAAAAPASPRMAVQHLQRMSASATLTAAERQHSDQNLVPRMHSHAGMSAAGCSPDGWNSIPL